MDVAARGVSAIVEYDYAAQEPDELDLIKGAILHSIKQMPGGWWEGTLQSNGKTGMFPDNFVRVIDNDENKVTMRDKAATINRRCKVIFSYTQVNDDELSLAVGDVIEFLGEVEEGWWRGRLKNKIGVFPSNFVTVIEPSPILASKRPSAGPIASTITTTTTSKSATTTAAASLLEKSSVVGISSTSTSLTNSNAVASPSTSTTTKKMNRLSFHNSKEDLLNSSSISSSSIATASTINNTTLVDDVAPSLPPKPQREYCRVEYPYAPQNDDELELKVGEVITIISMDLPDKGWWKGELHGKVGVFPDNFVKLIDVTSLSDSQNPQRTAKTSTSNTSAGAANANTASHIRSATGAAATSAAHTTAATSKVFIKKSGSNSSTQSSNRKDSFGSYDSLNDILSETGLQSGNVAAQRKSLENKNLDLTANAADAGNRLVALKKQQQQETTLTNNGSITTTTTTTRSMSSSSTAAVANELRKSLESLDEKTKTPPPVLTKKPTVTTKKPSTVTGVASNLFGFGKQKTKSTDSKLTTAASQDFADGMGSSKMSSSGQNDAVVLRRAATISVEDAEFDRLERGSILTDLRAGRVKAPKRRPPSAAINIIGESNNNNTIYLNGSSSSGGGGAASGGELSQEEGKLQSSDENSTGEESLAKPKPREWEKKKAPWMDELKASQQVKKKTSPSVEPRSTQGTTTTVADRASRLLGDDVKATSNNHNFTNSSAITSSSSSSSHSTTTSSSTTTKLQQSSGIMQQSMTVESSSQQLLKKELNSNTGDIMTKSMSNKFNTHDSTLSNSATTTTAPNTTHDDVRMRPNSLSIRNRSISPAALVESGGGSTGNSSARTTALKSYASPASTIIHEQPSSNGTMAPTSSNQNSTGAHNLYQPQRSSNNVAAPTSADTARIGELERRVGKLEHTVVAQQHTIDELVRLLREETDRVKVLRGELDKYAQCVTQV